MSFLHLTSSRSLNTIPLQPVVTTQAASNVSSTTVTGNGTLVATRGNTPVTDTGIAYSSSSLVPNIVNDSFTSSGSTAVGAFTSSLTGLSATTLYYCRAYATNVNGTSYGEVVTFTTADAGAAVYNNMRMMMGMGM